MPILSSYDDDYKSLDRGLLDESANWKGLSWHPYLTCKVKRKKGRETGNEGFGGQLLMPPKGLVL